MLRHMRGIRLRTVVIVLLALTIFFTLAYELMFGSAADEVGVSNEGANATLTVLGSLFPRVDSTSS